MSNEYKDYKRDLRSDFDDNFECALDSIPNGWMKYLIPQFKEELFNALGAYADEIMFFQIKEKFGELTVYWNFPDRDYYTEEDMRDIDELIPVVKDIIKRYSEISTNTCVVCGGKATYMTTWAYIAPFCDDCEVKRFAF